MQDSLFGDLSVINLRGGEQFASQVDYYLKEWSTIKSFLLKRKYLATLSLQIFFGKP